MNARHPELLRSRVRLTQTIDSLRPSSAFPDAFPSVGCASSFPACGFDPEVCDGCSLANGHSLCHKMADDQLHSSICRLPGEWICRTWPVPTWLCRLLVSCQFAPHHAKVEYGSNLSQTVTDHQCAPRRPTQGSRTPVSGPETANHWPQSSSGGNTAKMPEAPPVLTSLKPLPT